MDGSYKYLYRDGKLHGVPDSKGIENLFHSTVINPYTRPYLAVIDIRNPTGKTHCKTSVNQVNTISDENDKQFPVSRQRGYDRNISKDGLKIFDRADLPPTLILSANDLCCASNTSNVLTRSSKSTGFPKDTTTATATTLQTAQQCQCDSSYKSFHPSW